MGKLNKQESIFLMLYSAALILALFAGWYACSWIFRVSDQVFEMSLAGAIAPYQAFWSGCIAFLLFALALVIQTADAKKNRQTDFGNGIDKRYYNPK